MFSPSATHSATPSGRVIVLAPGAIPTTDYYVRPRLSAIPGIQPEYLDSLSERPEHHERSLNTGVFVIVVRWSPVGWLRLLERHAERLSGVALLLDDDVGQAWKSRDLPTRYAARTSARFWLMRQQMSQVCDRLWVSTPALRSLYPGPRTRIMEPLCFDTEFPAPSATRTWSYHGSASHRREIAWLKPLVKRLHRHHADYGFEIFGKTGVRKLFADIPGVTVQDPMPWPAYLEYSRTVARSVGLAPLLDSQFNRARSFVKVFDITRCGAVGIYSDTPPFRGNITHGREGLLLPNDPLEWAKAVESLMSDPARRRVMHQAAVAWCRARSRDPEFRRELGHGNSG
ncbi:MAG TPA: glycosyltransferase [Burkholderiales bacterium]